MKIVMWILFFVSIGAVVMTFVIDEIQQYRRHAYLSACGIAAFLFALHFNPFVEVQTGTLGIVKTWGEVDGEPLQPGLHVVIPFMQSVDHWNTRVMKQVTIAPAGSKDLQNVRAAVALNFRINPATIIKTYTTVGSTIGTTIIDPAVLEIVKGVTAKYTATELITKREEVRDLIREGVTRRITPYGLIVDEFSITDFSFSKSFSESIEAKQVAEQSALKAERDLQRIKVEAEQKVAQAQAEAQSLRLQKQEITDDLLRLRTIEMQTKAVEKWDGKLPTMTGGVVPFINLPTP